MFEGSFSFSPHLQSFTCNFVDHIVRLLSKYTNKVTTNIFGFHAQPRKTTRYTKQLGSFSFSPHLQSFTCNFADHIVRLLSKYTIKVTTNKFGFHAQPRKTTTRYTKKLGSFSSPPPPHTQYIV